MKINLLREIKKIIISGLFAVMRNSCFALNITLRRFVQKVQKKKVGVKKTLQRKNRFTNRLSLRQIKKKKIKFRKSSPLRLNSRRCGTQTNSLKYLVLNMLENQPWINFYVVEIKTLRHFSLLHVSVSVQVSL